MKLKNVHRSQNFQKGVNGIRTHDLCDTGAMLYQLSCEATHWERGQLIEFMIILHFHLHSPCKYELLHIYFTAFHSSREDLNSINWTRSHARGCCKCMLNLWVPVPACSNAYTNARRDMSASLADVTGILHAKTYILSTLEEEKGNLFPC